MKSNGNSKVFALFAALGAIPVIYIGVLLSVGLSQTDNILQAVMWASDNPTSAYIVDNTPMTVTVLLALYLGLVFYTTYGKRKNTRYGEEHGDAKWGNIQQINHELEDRRSLFENKILSQKLYLSFDGHRTNTNLNTLVDGGSGAGKTKSIIQPNILQCNTSYVILDPKGESLADNGNLLLKEGYIVNILNLNDMSQSDHYNPFAYINCDDDVQKVATMIMNATKPEKSTTNDPYWDQQAEVLLKALMFYLFYEAPDYEQNFSFLMYLLREAVVIEGKEEEQSVVDELFDELEAKCPNHIAVRYYRDYRNVPGKTLNTIQSMLKGRLEKFNLDSVADLTSFDNLDLPSMGLRKTALFIVTPVNDKSLNFLVSVLYLQMFQQWERLAFSLPGKIMPVHIQVLMDEFNNVKVPDDFENTLSVCRSMGFSFTIILQNMAQLKAKYEKLWESVVGNCDTFVYLGGNELGTHKYVSERLGKETIYTQSHNRSHGKSGSYSTNEQTIARDLMTPSEVGRLNKKYAIIFVKGYDPIMDVKYNVWKHPNAKYTSLGTLKNGFRKTLLKIALGRERIMLDVRIADAVMHTRAAIKVFAKIYLKHKGFADAKVTPEAYKKVQKAKIRKKASVKPRKVLSVLFCINGALSALWNNFKKNVLEPMAGAEPYVFGGQLPKAISASVHIAEEYDESRVIDLNKLDEQAEKQKENVKNANYL